LDAAIYFLKNGKTMMDYPDYKDNISKADYKIS